jgi:hypothetical protein
MSLREWFNRDLDALADFVAEALWDDLEDTNEAMPWEFHTKFLTEAGLDKYGRDEVKAYVMSLMNAGRIEDVRNLLDTAEEVAQMESEAEEEEEGEEEEGEEETESIV